MGKDNNGLQVRGKRTITDRGSSGAEQLTIYYQSLEGGNNKIAVAEYAKTRQGANYTVPTINLTKPHNEWNQANKGPKIKGVEEGAYKSIIKCFIDKCLATKPDIFILAEYYDQKYCDTYQHSSGMYKVFSIQGCSGNGNNQDSRRSMTLFVKNDHDAQVVNLDHLKEAEFFGKTSINRGEQKLSAMILAWMELQTLQQDQTNVNVQEFFKKKMEDHYYNPMQNLEGKYKEIAQCLGQCFRIKYRGRSVVVAHTINANVKKMLDSIPNEMLTFYDVILGDLNLRKGHNNKVEEKIKLGNGVTIRPKVLDNVPAENDGVIFSPDLFECDFTSAPPVIEQNWLSDHHGYQFTFTLKSSDKLSSFQDKNVVQKRFLMHPLLYHHFNLSNEGSALGATTLQIVQNYDAVLQSIKKSFLSNDLQRKSIAMKAEDCIKFIQEKVEVILELDELQQFRNNKWIFPGMPEVSNLQERELQEFLNQFRQNPLFNNLGGTIQPVKKVKK